MDDRLQKIDWLTAHFRKLPAEQKEELRSAFETISSQTLLSLEYHTLSLADIMEIACETLSN